MRKTLVLAGAVALTMTLALSACGTHPAEMRSQSKLRPRQDISAIDTKTPANKYVVKSNESAQEIADINHVSLDDLIRANPGLFGDLLGNPSQGGGQAAQPNGGRTGAPTGAPTGTPATDPNAALPRDSQVNLPSKESMTGYEQEVLNLTNAERQKAGLKPCAGDDSSLNRSARAKSEDMAANNYFSHDSPTYGDPFAMMRNFGVQYQSAGENIAKGQPTPQEVVKAWMDSPGHRANILNGTYTHLGVGYVANNGQPCWTQQFISK